MAPVMKPSIGREPNGYGFQSNNLWVGSLTTDTTESDLADFFGRFGEIDRITAFSSRSFAFIYYRRVEEAVAAKDALQGANLNGSLIKIEFARPAKPCKSLWVGGISPSVSKDDLEAEFRNFGKIEDFRFLRERKTAFIDFYNMEDAIEAKNMNGKRMGNSHLRVDFLRSQGPRKEPWPGSNDGRDGSLSAKQQYPHSFGDAKGERRPSNVLRIGYPPSVQIDEQTLHNCMILFGEIERCISYPSRHFSLVEFRSIEEARCAKEGLHGRLLNDPRITIMYSNDDIPPGRGDDTSFYSGAKRSRPEMLVNDPPFISSPHSSGFFGSMRPFRGSVERSHSGPEYSDVVGTEESWGRPSPTEAGKSGILPFPAPHTRLPVRSNRGSWEGYDPAQLDREPKRTRRDGSVDVFPSMSVDDRVTGFDRTYGRGSVAARSGRGFSDTDFIWRGIIAKGGTTICRARCVPFGKGTETELPEIVNCSARTGLDMLAKHYTEAIGFEIVFFLPDREDDFASYTEFLCYLGSKNRAGVAKLDDGTTLFLVPPSDFLTDVLNVSGPERLYGVVLKLPPPQVPAAASYKQEPYPIPQSYMGQSRSLPANANNGLFAARENRAVFEYNRGMQEESKPSPKSLLGPLSESVSVPNTAMPQAGVSLTPELLATLASFLPTTSQPTASEGHQSVGLSSGEAPSQAWNRDQSTVSDPSNLSFQQLGNQYNPMGQLPPPPPLPPPPMHYPPVSSTPSYSSGMVHGGMQYQAPFVSTPQQAPLPTPPSSNYAMYSQGSHQAVSQPLSQQYQPEAPMLNQNYIPVPGAENPVLHGYQQGNYHCLTNNQAHNANPSQSQTAMPPPANMKNLDLFSQAQQQLQPLLLGAGQGTSDGEVDKNQRYQSTLQLAANLLQQIQQQQQLPSDASTVQGP
ncbi:RNA recognition motif domain [Arabidopsis thaliana x Arabidopsis arenosa]|uniref:RNA recognition motif domain n=2 Tax=Arabidopsis thaliana x Arabidopsis arenosa TaxID=1240361 RepID=A0A8T1ZTJ4_9BRAS|nr:RNA recognition motif domain [Arabidopsis thaliana x Arabidopsis arenosa]